VTVVSLVASYLNEGCSVGLEKALHCMCLGQSRPASQRWLTGRSTSGGSLELVLVQVALNGFKMALYEKITELLLSNEM